MPVGEMLKQGSPPHRPNSPNPSAMAAKLGPLTPLNPYVAELHITGCNFYAARIE